MSTELNKEVSEILDEEQYKKLHRVKIIGDESDRVEGISIELGGKVLAGVQAFKIAGKVGYPFATLTLQMHINPNIDVRAQLEMLHGTTDESLANAPVNAEEV